MTLETAVAKVVEKHGGIRATERATGIDKSFLSRLMRGEKTHPSEETLAKLEPGDIEYASWNRRADVSGVKTPDGGLTNG